MFDTPTTNGTLVSLNPTSSQSPITNSDISPQLDIIGRGVSHPSTAAPISVGILSRVCIDSDALGLSVRCLAWHYIDRCTYSLGPYIRRADTSYVEHCHCLISAWLSLIMAFVLINPVTWRCCPTRSLSNIHRKWRRLFPYHHLHF